MVDGAAFHYVAQAAFYFASEHLFAVDFYGYRSIEVGNFVVEIDANFAL